MEGKGLVFIPPATYLPVTESSQSPVYYGLGL